MDEVSPLLQEWDYGNYEGLTTPQIRETVPDWLIWTHGAEGGESIAAVTERADGAVALALEHMATRDVVFVGHGHFSRSVIARWVELTGAIGNSLCDGGRLDRGAWLRARGSADHRAGPDRPYGSV